MSRRQADNLFKELKNHLVFPRSKEIWAYREQLCIPASQRFPSQMDDFSFGHARYVDTEALVNQIFQVSEEGVWMGGALLTMFFEQMKPLVKTMQFDLKSTSTSINRILLSFSVDGAELNATSGAIFGFLRVLNQVDYIDSPLMQYPILLAQTAESREFFGRTLPTCLNGLIKLSETGVDVVCIDDNCQQYCEYSDHSHK